MRCVGPTISKLGGPVVGEARAHASPRIDSQPLTSCTKARFSGTAIPGLSAALHDGTVDHVDLRPPARLEVLEHRRLRRPRLLEQRQDRVDPLLRVDVVAQPPRDRDRLARRLGDQLVHGRVRGRARRVSSRSGRRSGSVAALRISFFQISGRTGEATLASSPPSASACASRPGRRRRSVPRRTSPRSSAGRRDARPGPAPGRRPLLYVTPTTICSAGTHAASTSPLPHPFWSDATTVSGPTSGRALSAAPAVW